jgi:signal transduction histidine kinase
VLAVPLAGNHVLPPREPGWPVGLAAVLVAVCVAVALARRLPLGGLAIVILGCVVDGNFTFGIPVMSYVVGRRMDRAWPAAALFGVAAVGGTALDLGVLDTEPSTWFLLAVTLLFAGVFPWLVGRYRRQAHELETMGWERVGHLERDREMVAVQARLRERTRITRDMHDSLGHDLSLLALRAGALEVADLPSAQRAAAADVRAGAVAATERLREILGLLRDDASPAPLAPHDEGTDALVERARASGLEVTLHRDPGGGPTEAGGSHRAGYRVVQEALTNAAKHAPGAPVTVTLVAAAGSTTVTVTNPVPSGTAAVDGFGLAGLRERVRLAGGTFTAGIDPSSPRSFRVQAVLPHVTPPLDKPGRPPDAPLRTARRRVRRSLVVAVAVPAAIGMVMMLTYYPVAAFDTVLESSAYDRMRVGQPRGELPLPGRQAPTPAGVGGVTGASCEFYSDGNFPMASATYRLCFRDGLLVAKDEVR